ncbi:hypothetical protein CRUP_002680 [Coryphaenoides rupestris]|nr:hypothetical protein CRUP_002680 [Coryphaenoides rupestris]
MVPQSSTMSLRIVQSLVFNAHGGVVWFFVLPTLPLPGRGSRALSGPCSPLDTPRDRPPQVSPGTPAGEPRDRPPQVSLVLLYISNHSHSWTNDWGTNSLGRREHPGTRRRVSTLATPQTTNHCNWVNKQFY